MQYLKALLIVLLFTPRSLLSMQQPLAGAYDIVQSQKLHDVDDIPAYCTEIMAKLYRQPACSQPILNTEVKYINLENASDEDLVIRMNNKIKKTENRWNIKALTQHDPSFLATYGLKLTARDTYCSLERLGHAYEKVISQLKDGWSPILLSHLPSHAPRRNSHYLFYAKVNGVGKKLLTRLISIFNFHKTTIVYKAHKTLQLGIQADTFDQFQDTFHFNISRN